MGLLRGAARAYLLHRLTRGDGRRRSRSGRYGASRSPSPFLARRSPRRRSGFGMSPLPSYTRRTRGGSQVRVTGCCLPIPLALAAGTAVAARQMTRR
jgi:hypothetical protein